MKEWMNKVALEIKNISDGYYGISFFSGEVLKKLYDEKTLPRDAAYHLVYVGE